MTEELIGHVGDWIEEPSVDGSAPQRGLIVEVLGSGAHRHYRVRWDEEHESIHFVSPAARLHHHGRHDQATGASERSS
jgi:hypothetical protein